MIDRTTLTIIVAIIAFQILISAFYFLRKNPGQPGLKSFVLSAFFAWMQYIIYIFVAEWSASAVSVLNGLCYTASYYFMIRSFILQLNIRSNEKFEKIWFVLVLIIVTTITLEIHSPKIRVPILEFLTTVIPVCYLLILLIIGIPADKKIKEYNFVKYTFLVILVGHIAYVNSFNFFYDGEAWLDNNLRNYSVVILVCGHLSTVIAMLMIISGQKELQLLKLANTDSLTGLPTNRLALDRLDMAIKNAQREDHKVALLYLDLDGFKTVNDTYGHDAGDEVLKTIATRINSTIRATDTACRIGGDEFIIVLPGLKPSFNIEDTCNSIIDAIGKTVSFNEHNLVVGVSIGVALYPDHADDIMSLRKKADEKMYDVKKQGKNNFELASV